jgi:hypothetical protein
MEEFMKKLMFTICSLVLIVTVAARAHWQEGEPYKMHYPQLPDELGYDIDMTNYVLADDWGCTETGLVEDIHFWYSVQNGDDIYPPHFSQVKVSIHDDDRTGAFSKPGAQRWGRTFSATEIIINGPFDGYQGWDNPEEYSNCRYPDHYTYWQVNITDIDSPFIQQEGNIYWLDLQVMGVEDPYNHAVGWKETNVPYWEDAAVYRLAAGGSWERIAVCSENRFCNLAFVITPEPATMAILGLGSLVLLPRRRRSK